MNWDSIAGNWKQITGKVKAKWGKLTDDDITQINGNNGGSRAKSRRATDTPRTRCRTSSRFGSTGCRPRST